MIPFARDYKGFIANITPADEKEGGKNEVLAVVDRLEQNRVPILYVSKLIIRLTDELRKKIRGDNKLSSDNKTTALEALDKLQGLSREAQQMSEASPEELIENREVQSWPKRFKSAIEENLRTTLDAKNVADAALPTGLILGCGALGALIGGPVGFGAGSVVGHLITGQIKPGAAAKTIEGAVLQKD